MLLLLLWTVTKCSFCVVIYWFVNVFCASVEPLKIQLPRSSISNLMSLKLYFTKMPGLLAELKKCQGMTFHASPTCYASPSDMARFRVNRSMPPRRKPSQPHTCYASPSACDTKAFYQFTLRSNQSQIHLIYIHMHVHRHKFIWSSHVDKFHLIISCRQVHVLHISTYT
jgi:hypothetical protein